MAWRSHENRQARQGRRGQESTRPGRASGALHSEYARRGRPGRKDLRNGCGRHALGGGRRTKGGAGRYRSRTADRYGYLSYPCVPGAQRQFPFRPRHRQGRAQRPGQERGGPGHLPRLPAGDPERRLRQRLRGGGRRLCSEQALQAGLRDQGRYQLRPVGSGSRQGCRGERRTVLHRYDPHRHPRHGWPTLAGQPPRR